jgi:hypothetical protein
MKMSMFSLGDSVKLALPSFAGEFVPTRARVIGRTWGQKPTYDLALESDTRILNVPGDFLVGDADAAPADLGDVVRILPVRLQ